EGTVITGYDFDKTYDDIEGGQYRIQFSSGPGTKEVTIVAEGRDSGANEVRALQVVFKNQTINGAVITGGVLSWSNKFEVHWGPVMANGNIDIDSNASQEYSPRKFSQQVVSCANKGNERDTNGLNPPNTDNAEWWSDYDVPDLPVLDFAALRASAQATNTLNVYGCNWKSGSGKKAVSHNDAPWSIVGKNVYSCCSKTSKTHTDHFQDTDRHPDSKKNYIWYWDNDVILTWSTDSLSNRGSGIYGHIIVRGNCILDTKDDYQYTCNVPSEAWREYTKITKTTGDTAACNEYPADDGYQKNRTTFNLGNETWKAPGSPSAANTDVGIRGFMYVGGNLDLKYVSDINGAVWVVGNVTKSASGFDSAVIYFDENLENIPTLNVVLRRQTWQEISPDTTAWP
ncbi:MAG: hypothetical protein ABII23_07360, partial [bacterium]